MSTIRRGQLTACERAKRHFSAPLSLTCQCLSFSSVARLNFVGLWVENKCVPSRSIVERPPSFRFCHASQLITHNPPGIRKNDQNGTCQQRHRTPSAAEMKRDGKYLVQIESYQSRLSYPRLGSIVSKIMGIDWSSACQSAVSRSLQVATDVDYCFCGVLVSRTASAAFPRRPCNISSFFPSAGRGFLSLCRIQCSHVEALSEARREGQGVAALRDFCRAHVLRLHRWRTFLDSSHARAVVIVRVRG